MLNKLTTRFITRLRARDAEAWFELWDIFGPILRAQLARWGGGRIGPETVQDLSQETLAALSSSIERHDPSRGARFSTWLLAIARHILGDEIDRRMALKRGGGEQAVSLEDWEPLLKGGGGPDAPYETAIFRAKVAAAIRLVERESDFLEFSVYRMRVFDGLSGKQVAEALGISEPTVSRKLSAIRDRLRKRLQEVIATYSFTPEELAEAERNGLDLGPNNVTDAQFDESLAEIYHRQVERDEGRSSGSTG